ncbi:hypothetical protein [Phytohalomonas tamaricis]|uniref:hypothetical protein n=1 Tax=Phytohalomonas tamaricis TaxID=2081032 RepID=UPI000D0B8942|nr:hypothetical protein [Phytohalomonas tamaricis]
MPSPNVPLPAALQKKQDASFFLRLVIYIALTALAAQLMMWDAQLDGDAIKFTELSITELTQTFILFVSPLLLLYIRARFSLFRTGTLIMASFLLASLIREQDAFLDDYLFDGCWKILVALLAVPTLIYTWKKRRRLMRELKYYSTTASYGLFLAGFLVVYVFARLYGRSAFWMAVLEQDYSRSIKNAAEEGTEMIGYLLVLFAVMELLFLARRLHRSAASVA